MSSESVADIAPEQAADIIGIRSNPYFLALRQTHS
jgi:hypothetical protein